MYKYKEKKDLIHEATEKIAGEKHGCSNEVQEQVRKAKKGGTAKSTDGIVKNLMAKK